MSNKVILIVYDEQNYVDTIAETLKEKKSNPDSTLKRHKN